MRPSQLGSPLALALSIALPSGLAAAPCDSPIQNPIVCESTRPGNPSSGWDVSGSGDATIQGLAAEISVNHGQTVRFEIGTPATSSDLDIDRMGYDAGSGARKVAANVLPSATSPQAQPACLTDAASGLSDSGNWGESASWVVPANAVSGIYFARLVRNDTLESRHVVFIVRDDEGHSPSYFFAFYKAYVGSKG